MQFALVLIAIFVLSFAGVSDGRAACIPVPVNCSSINNQTTCMANNCTWEQAESCRSVPGAPPYIRCGLHSNRIDCETNTFPYCRWYSTWQGTPLDCVKHRTSPKRDDFLRLFHELAPGQVATADFFDAIEHNDILSIRKLMDSVDVNARFKAEICLLMLPAL